MSAVLKHIADLAKQLTPSELHVLIELAARAESAVSHDALASSRDLAERTGLVRASVQTAIDSLNKKGLIWSDKGSTTRAACHRLLFLDAVEIREGGHIPACRTTGLPPSSSRLPTGLDSAACCTTCNCRRSPLFRHRLLNDELTSVGRRAFT
jgi:hypothetical protein